MVSALAGILLVIGIAAADDAVTFENLHTHLSAEHTGAIHNFDSLLAAAREGSLEARLTLADKIYFDRLQSQAVGLYRQIYQEHGYAFQDLDRPEAALAAYARLGDMYLEGRGTALDPQAGFRLLTELAAKRHDAAIHSMAYFLSESPYLPESDNLGSLWAQYAETGVLPVPADDAEESWEDDRQPPEDSQFGSCPNAFGQTSAIVEHFHARQAAMLEDGRATPVELSAAYKSFEFAGVGNGHQALSFQFSNISARVLFEIMGEMLADDLQLKTDPRLHEIPVLVHGKNVPSMVVFSRLVEALQLEVSCAGQWVSIAPGEARSEPGKIFFFPNFIVRRNPLTGSNGSELVWQNGVRYEGALNNGRPNGQGRLIVSDHPQTGSQIVGEFRDGVPHGRAVYSTADKSMTYSGEFQNGLFHGQGHLTDNSGTEFKGLFVHDLFQGSGSQYLKGDADRQGPWLLYQGPFKDAAAHGTGLCRTALGDYECELAKGYLVGLGDVALLPGQTPAEVSQ